MRVTLQTTEAVVLDDVLPPERFEALARYVRDEAVLKSVHADGYDRGWRFDDGSPLASPSVLLEVHATAAGLRPAPPLPLQGPDRYAFPTDAPFDHVIDAVLETATAWSALVGKPPAAWRTLAARVFVYPPRTSLGWHDDATNYAGAFTFYAHPRWEPDWGGELLVQTPGAQGVGLCLLPRPNRLVVLRGGVSHKVCRVAPYGDIWRASVSGFFDTRTLSEEAPA